MIPHKLRNNSSSKPHTSRRLRPTRPTAAVRSTATARSALAEKTSVTLWQRITGIVPQGLRGSSRRLRTSRAKNSRAKTSHATKQPGTKKRRLFTRLPRFKVNKNFAGVALLIALLGGFAGVVGTWIFLQSLSFPGREMVRLQDWQGDHNLNVLFIGVNDEESSPRVSALQLSYLRPQEKKMSLLAINPELGVTRSGGRIVNYRALLAQLISEKRLASAQSSGSIYAATQNPEVDVVKYSAIEEFIYLLEADLGIKIDRYILVEKSAWLSYVGGFVAQNPANDEQASASRPDTRTKLQNQNQQTRRYIAELTSVIKTPIYLRVLPFLAEGRGLATNFKTSELIKLIEVFRGIPSYNVTEQVTSDDLAYIREGVLLLDRSKFDNSLKRSYADVQVQIEQGRLDVVNGSGRAGLAGKTRRLLTNYGYNIVKVDNTSQKLTRNTLYVPTPEEFPATIESLVRIFPDLDVRSEDYPNRPTGDMVLVVI